MSSGLSCFRNIRIAFVSAILIALGTSYASANTITVNSTADVGSSGICVLRDAITAANTNAAVNGCAAGSAGADSIAFSASGTITLGGMLPSVTEDLTITGPAGGVTINGNNNVRAFFVGPNATLNLVDLTITNCNPQRGGGAVVSAGTLNVTGCTFSHNSAIGGGGAIEGAMGAVNVSGTTFASNSATSQGGAISSAAANVTVQNGTFSGNTAGGGANSGGAVFNGGGTVTVTSSTLAGGGADGNCGGTITDGGGNTSDDGSCHFSNTVASNTGK